VRAQELAEHLVGRVRQVLCPVGSTAKSHNKTVGKSLLKIFHAYISAPFEIVYCLDLARKCAESSLDLADLLVGGVVLELEQHDVSQQTARHLDLALGDAFIIRGVPGLMNCNTAG